MTQLTIRDRPNLQRPNMILGFSGWMDGSEVSTGTIELLAEEVGAHELGEISPGDFYIYNFPGSMEISALFRPHAVIEDGRITSVEEPENTFFYSEKHNLILFKGKEPNLRWQEYAECIYEVVEEFDVSFLSFVGSVATIVPHTREPIFYSSTSDEATRDRADRNGLGATNYEGPASFVSYLAKHAQDRGIPMATIVAGIPPYVQGRNMITIEAVFKKLVGMGAVNIDFDTISRLSAEFREGLDKLVGSKPELEEQIRELEQAYDEQLGADAEDNDEDAGSQEDLGDWFNRQGIELE